MRRARGRGAKWVVAVAMACACDDADEPTARDAAADAATLPPPDALGPTGIIVPDPALPLVADVTTHDFDLAIGALGERRFTFTNVGPVPLGPLLTGLEPNVTDFVLTDGCLIKVLAPSEACIIDVQWTPQTTGSFDTRLFVAVTGTGAGPFRVEVALRGRVRLLEAPLVEPSAYDFGAVEVGEESAVVELSITTPVALPSSAITAALSEVGDFRVASDGCTGRSLAANERCAVGVTYAPRTLGAHGTMLRFSQAGGGSSSARLSGFGVAPPLGPSP